MPRKASLLDDSTYQAMAKYVSLSQLSESDGVIADEIIRDLDIARSTVYKKLKMPGFYKTARPFNPQGYGYDIKLAKKALESENLATHHYVAYSKQMFIDILLGRLELRATNPKGINPVEHVNDFNQSTTGLISKATAVANLGADAELRINRFIGGDGAALNPAADLKYFRALAELVSSCRIVSELGQTILLSEELNSPDYWKVFR